MLDWDQHQLLVVASTVKRGSVKIDRAVAWQEEPSSPANAEAQGRLLRERLKAAGIAPAPVLACVGRDRVVVKEIRYPSVPSSEEPAVVRFQAVKELTDSPDEVVIDYAPIGDPQAGGERRAAILVLKRDILKHFQALCQAAGLKLAGLCPRPFGTAACLKRVAGTTVLTPVPEPPDAAVAVLTATERWAEFSVVRGEQVLFVRALSAPALANSNALWGEIRRNLTVYAGQAASQPVRAIYIAGSIETAALHGRLKETLNLPVHMLDPFAGDERPELPTGNRSAFVGPVGLLYAQAQHQQLPINFVQPKQPRPARDPNQRRYVFAAVVAALLLLGVGLFGYAQLAQRDSELEKLTQEKADLDRLLAQTRDDASRIKAIGDWAGAEVVWLDELYDLTQRFPDPRTVRLVQLTGDSLTRTGAAKHTAKMAIKGIANNDYRSVDALMAHLVEDGYYRVEPKVMSRNTGLDRQFFNQQFTTRVDIEPRPSNRFVRQLPPPDSTRSRNRGPRDEGNVDLESLGLGEQP
jgi:Tfp pilus assembly PilM family ATPase